MTSPRPVLLTGASGNLGRQITRHLAGLGWTAVLTDIAPFPDPVPAGMRFEAADLTDKAAIDRLAEGCGTILHFGGVSVEKPFEVVLGPNITGLWHIYEAARHNKARVVFASSNHAIGFHTVDTVLDEDCHHLPDGFYGLSKAYGELMGRLYWHKHGVESISVRIGSSFVKPVDPRMLSTWLSFGDLCRLMERCVLATDVRCDVIWGASANRLSWWGRDARERIGWTPQDSADAYAAELEGKPWPTKPPNDRYQGGGYTAMDYTREEPSPASAAANGR